MPLEETIYHITSYITCKIAFLVVCHSVLLAGHIAQMDKEKEESNPNHK